ncbi:histidine kinase [Flammeovirgaceae bacterium SG7u.111]|nr:histidine kinase [Flammeovirgaceae bacterium SG7u.132]WPO34409.1 histidine kinase [Flammeovirgaceae bacterium SG7u.111]
MEDLMNKGKARSKKFEHTLLYVDDEMENLRSFRSVFRREYNIHLANTAEEGLKILKENSDIQLIISDQRMPGTTGVEFLEKTLAIDPDAMRMLLTGYSDMKVTIEAVNRGKIYNYVSKPWEYEEFKIIIEKALEAYRLKMENRQLTRDKEELLVKAERQEKENIKAQLEKLRQQVNPHFLFNSLNMARALVKKDPSAARKFLLKLSKVYQYSLEFKEQNLVTLADEMIFIENYIYLQHIRFQEGLTVDIRVEERIYDTFVPPSTMQLLVENAIKHNVAGEHKPLSIEIYNEDDWLVVKNNIQPRNEHIESTKTGQKNLLSRYEYITGKLPEFSEKGGFYFAKVPLIREKIEG